MPNESNFSSPPECWAHLLPALPSDATGPRLAALQTIILGHYLRRPEELLARADDGKLEQMLDAVRRAAAASTAALADLSPQDRQWLEERGYL